MLIGVICGLAAGAFWGLTFVAPTAVRPYTEFDLAIMRYGVFGLTSLALMALSPRFRPGALSARKIGLALFLGFTGYVAYYLFVAFAISLSGPAITPLVIGALPVVLAIYGNWQDRNVPWRVLAVPLLLIVAGLAVIKGAAIASAASAELRGQVLLGGLLAFCGLGVWTLYAIVNAREMRRADAPGVLGWTSLQGVGAMLGVAPLVVIAPLAGWSELPVRGLAGPEGWNLIGWVILTGVFGSWIAQFFWTTASHRLPLALSAQLIVSETVFALIYGFAWNRRWPDPNEWLGGVLLLLGVFVGVRAFTRQGGH